MVADNRLFDDLARVAGGAVSLLSVMSKQIKSDVSAHAHGLAGKMDLADRKDVERLLALVAHLRLEQESIKARLDALEGKKPAVKKTVAKNKTVKKKSSPAKTTSAQKKKK